MLTPRKIHELVKEINEKYAKPLHGRYPPQKKIMDYISRQIGHMSNNKSLNDITKVKEMTNLLEGFIRYLNNTNVVLKLGIEKILTYIYYPESEETTLDNKDNLLIGSKGQTVRLWHDAYFMTNREHIINCLIKCKNVLYGKVFANEFIKTDNSGMPEQMQRMYEEMLGKHKQTRDEQPSQIRP